MTTIMATIGPSIDQAQTLDDLVKRGVRSFRIPASKRSRTQIADLAELIEGIASRQEVSVDVLIDLPGDKTRLTNDEPVTITAGRRVEIRYGRSSTMVDADRITFGCEGPGLDNRLTSGDILVVGDGEVALDVTDVGVGRCLAISMTDGTVLRRHGVTRLGGLPHSAELVAADRSILQWVPTTALTGVMVSFVETPETVQEARSVLANAGDDATGQHIVIAKVETAGGVERCDAIAREADAVLLGRGDLLLDVGPIAFHRVCERARMATQEAGRPFITGTQLLTSLLNSWLPNRSELSEVSRLIDVGVDCLLLSDETIWFPHPMRVIDLLADLINATGQSEPPRSLGEQSDG